MPNSSIPFANAVEFLFNCVAIRVNDNELVYLADLDDGEDSIYFDYDETDRAIIEKKDNEVVYFSESGAMIFNTTQGETVNIQALTVTKFFA